MSTFSDIFGGGDSKSIGLNFLFPLTQVSGRYTAAQGAKQAQSEKEEAQKQYRAILRKMGLENDVQEVISSNLLNSSPKIDLSKYSNELTDLYSGTSSNVNKYLTKGDEYIASMLSETNKGANNYLSEYKDLARSEMPGMQIYRDQAGTSLANSISQLKSMGGATSSNITDLLQENQENQMNLALESGKYKTTAQKDLANAFMTAAQAKANAYNTAASNAEQNAGIQLNLGKFGTDITTAKGEYANREYEYNELQPYQNKLSYSINKENKTDPYQAYLDYYGSLIGMYNAEKQGQMQAYYAANTSGIQSGQRILGSIIGKVGGGG
jgi:hypothetical protein